MTAHSSAGPGWTGRDRPHGTRVRGADAVAAGHRAPLGATPTEDGVNLSVFSKGADLVELLLFDDPQTTEAAGHHSHHPRAAPLDRLARSNCQRLGAAR